jgi:hypothetical protein
MCNSARSADLLPASPHRYRPRQQLPSSRDQYQRERHGPSILGRKRLFDSPAPATVRAMLHVGWRRQSLKVCNRDFILARATASYGCSTLTPAGPDANVLTHEWPEVAGQRPSSLDASDLIVVGPSTTQSGQAQGRKAALRGRQRLRSATRAFMRVPCNAWLCGNFALPRMAKTRLYRPRCRSKNRAISLWYSLTSGAVISLMYCACD